MMDYNINDVPLDVKNYDRMFSDGTNGTWSRDIPTYTDARLLKSIYFTEDWIYITVDKIAMNLAGVPLRVYKESIVNGETMSEPADSHPVQYILDNPNQFQTSYAHQYAAITDFCVTGNAIIYNAMINRNLIHIPAENINMDIDGNGNLRSYSIIGFDSHSMPFSNLRSKIDPRSIIHIKRPNASSIHWGMSPLIPGQSPVLFNRYSSEYLTSFYKRGAQPGMVVTTPETATDKQRESLQLSLEKHNSGRGNQRRFLVLPNGAKGEVFAHTISDQQLLDHIKHNRETIINLFGIPKEVLSIQDTGSGLGSDQYKQALKSFWTGTLMSIGNIFAEAYNKAFQSYLGNGYKIKRDYSQVPELQEDLKLKSELANSMLTTMTMNEIRKKVWKLDPIEGGDKIASMNPQQAMYPYGQQSYPQQAFQAALPKPEPELDKQLEQPETLDYKSQNLMNFGKFIQAEGKSWWDKQEVSTMGQTQAKEDPIREMFMEMIIEQVATASNIAKDVLIQKTVSINNEAELEKKIKNAFQKQRADWVKKYESTLNAQVELGYDSILNMPFGKPDEEAIATIRDEGYKNRRKELFKRAETSFDYLARTTIKKIFSTIKSGIKGNKSLSEIRTNIKDIAKVSLGRADAIARTEVLTAISIGQKAAMNDAGKVLPDLYKVWINANDERVRGNPGGIYPDSKGDHWNIAGEAIPYKEKFANGLDHPREGGGAAHEVINCFVEETEVTALDTKKLFRRFYSGPIVTVNLKSGAKITGTPNHPMLTSEGWVTMGQLSENQKLIKASFRETVIHSKSDMNYIKASFGEVFSSGSQSGTCVSATGTSSDFHGDGSSDNVDIVFANSKLHCSLETVRSEKSVDFFLVNTDFTHGDALCLCAKCESSRGVTSAHTIISSSNLLSSSLNIHGGPFEDFSVAPSSLPDSMFLKSSTNTHSGIIKFPADFKYREVLDEVQIDEIINIDIKAFSGHVYNLESNSSWYLANGYITHNCRCTLIAVDKQDLERLGITNIRG